MSNIDRSKKEFSLSDLDVEMLTKALSEHQNTAIKAVLVVVSLILAIVMFVDHHKKDQDMRIKMSQTQEKLNSIQSHNLAVIDLDTFKRSIRKNRNEVQLISLISKLAKSNNVIISSLDPAGNKDFGLYDITKVNFNLESDDYKSMMLF